MQNKQNKCNNDFKEGQVLLITFFQKYRISLNSFQCNNSICEVNNCYLRNLGFEKQENIFSRNKVSISEKLLAEIRKMRPSSNKPAVKC